MEEHNIRFIERTFGELEKSNVPDVKDPYNIMSSLGSKMREAVLHNPTGYREDETCQILALDGDLVIGATNPFPGRMLLNGETVQTLNGSYLYAHEDYRKDNIGGELFFRESRLHPSGNTLFAGISQMALPLYYALKFSVFEFPRLIYLRKSRSVIQSVLYNEGIWTKPIIWMADSCLWLHRCLMGLTTKLRLGSYRIEEVKQCPQEVEDIVIADEHPYMELHDKAWFDWSLNFSISEDERTKKRLYVIRRNGKIEGFFLVKQEFFEKASNRGFRNVYLGSVMEWGISKGSKLTEKDIALLSLSCFDKDVDGIQYASIDNKTVKQLKHRLFVQIGFANMAIKMRYSKDVAIKEIKNWRIRLAASDTVLN